ncbi:hypothetical protein J14TS5_34270 [Paenibacillus lautus]|nr:hypothetical protein J14TS5_34270 [Paenibacillus lautus]
MEILIDVEFYFLLAGVHLKPQFIQPFIRVLLPTNPTKILTGNERDAINTPIPPIAAINLELEPKMPCAKSTPTRTIDNMPIRIIIPSVLNILVKL